jgi:PIN domain nuclease of toxin-antitoxin system
MSKTVLDASALLAVIINEPGAEEVASLFPNAVISSVNLAEVHSKLVRKGVPKDEAWTAASALVHEVIDFDADQARIAGDLAGPTKSLGLSLGDRACLALGATLHAPVYTADRSWKQLKLGIDIRVLRAS